MRKNMQLLDLTLAHKNPTRTGNVMDIFICNKSVATLPYTLNIDLTCAVQLFFRESHQVLAFNIVGPKVQPSATVANCITYNITVMQYNAGPAWWGYTLVDDRARVNGFFCHQQRNSAHRSLIAWHPFQMGSGDEWSQKTGFLHCTDHIVDNLMLTVEERLYKAIVQNEQHFPRQLFLPLIRHSHNLRPRAHNYVLQAKDDKSLVPRILYKLLS